MRWTWGSWLAVLTLASGCQAIDFSQFAPQHAARSRVVPELAGVHCERGGQALQTGLDLNDNGQLDDDEVTSTEYACAPQDSRVLVRTQPVPPGEKCAQGGQLSRAGLDTNDDGELQDGEVTREVYSCTEEPAPVLTRVSALTSTFVCPILGSAVEAGADVNRNGVLEASELQATLFLCAQDTTSVRARQQPEPAGDHCPLGGTRVEAGADTNRSGVLDDAEVTQVGYVCQPTRTYEGSYVVRNAADLSALQGVTRIHGGLAIQLSDLTEVVLPGLTAIEGPLSIASNAALTRVELRNLSYVGDLLLVVGNPKLDTLVLGGTSGERVWVETDVHLEDNAALTTLDGIMGVVPRRTVLLVNNDALQSGRFEFLEGLTGSFVIQGHASLQGLLAPRLQWVAVNVTVSDNDALTRLSGLGALRSVGGDVEISGDDALPSLEGLSSLDSIGRLSVISNNQLTSTSGLTQLVHAGDISIVNNPALELAGDMPLLTTVDYGLFVYDNPKLASVKRLPALETAGRQVKLRGNAVLSDLSGLQRIQRIDQFVVADDDGLLNLDDLSSLREVRQLFVQGNDGMTRLGLPGLVQVSEQLFVQENPVLPACQVDAFAARVFTGAPGQYTQSDNDDIASCGP